MTRLGTDRRPELLRAPAFLAGLALLADPAPPAGEELPRGRVIERITCAADPARSYALYLPTRYDPSRKWPVVYLLDARGRALAPLALFRPAAEARGFVLASSYDSASDQPVDPNRPAYLAIREDTRRRLALDDRRVVVAGFSGTARAACDLAEGSSGGIRSVIGAGAGFPSGRPPTATTRFAFFGTVGTEDFNYQEMLDLDATLDRLEVGHRLEIFDGPHSWMPEPLATRSLEWIDLRAMAAGELPRDDAWLEEAWRRELKEARAEEAAGDFLAARRRLVSAARDFRPLRDVAEAEREAGRLSASRGLDRQRRKAEALRRREEAAVLDLRRVLGTALHGDPRNANLGRILADLNISGWRRIAGKGEPEEARSARRILSTYRAQTGHYLPEQALVEGQPAAAALELRVATAVTPDDPLVWRGLAVAEVRSGRPAEALRALERFAALAPDRVAALAGDAEFAPLKGEAAFRRLLESPEPPEKK